MPTEAARAEELVTVDAWGLFIGDCGHAREQESSWIWDRRNLPAPPPPPSSRPVASIMPKRPLPPSPTAEDLAQLSAEELRAIILKKKGTCTVLQIGLWWNLTDASYFSIQLLLLALPLRATPMTMKTSLVLNPGPTKAIETTGPRRIRIATSLLEKHQRKTRKPSRVAIRTLHPTSISLTNTTANSSRNRPVRAKRAGIFKTRSIRDTRRIKFEYVHRTFFSYPYLVYDLSPSLRVWLARSPGSTPSPTTIPTRLCTASFRPKSRIVYEKG